MMRWLAAFLLSLGLWTSAAPTRAEVPGLDLVEQIGDEAWFAGRLDDVLALAEQALTEIPASAPVDQRFGARVRLIGLYERSAFYRGAGPRTLGRVRTLYDEARPLAREVGGDGPMLLDYMTAHYYNAANRTGRVAALMRSALADPVMASRPRERFVASTILALAESDMGLADNANANFARARAAVAQLPAAERPGAILQLNAMEMNARHFAGDVEAVRALWREDAAILGTTAVTPQEKVKTAIAALHFLNRIGDTDAAKEALRIVRTNARRDPLWRAGAVERLGLQMSIDCIMVLWSGDPRALAASPRFEQDYTFCKDFQFEQLRGQMGTAPAEVFELQGRNTQALAIYSDALEKAEAACASFDLEDRAAFFSGRWRSLYAGVVRIHTRAFERDPRALSEFARALVESERSRARQFAELTGDGAEPRSESANAEAAQAMLGFVQSLPEGTAVVVLASQERELVTLGFTRTLRHGAVIDVGEREVARRVEQIHRMLDDGTSDTGEIRGALDGLAADVLRGVRPVLRGARRVIVIADGPLTRIPFGLFAADEGGPPLMETAIVSNALSLRALQAPASPATGVGYFGVGAPAYPAPPALATLGEPLRRDALRRNLIVEAANGGGVFSPLPGTRREVIAAASAFDPAANATFAADGAQAFESAGARAFTGVRATETAVKASLARARFVHIATHGLLAGDLGLTEPALVLAADGANDGYLTASEVQALRPLGAEVAVLSACNTGNGRVVAGEGVLGLARAFMVAGARATVVSLWPVDDASTAELMARFYAKLRAGVAPSLALAEASRETRAQHVHPNYWAPFVLVENSLR